MKVHVTPKMFFGNYFCILKERHSAFVCISKNGCTFLKSISIYNKTGLLIEEERQIHDYVGYSPSNGFLIPVESMPAYEKENGTVLKFAVWRDPVERLISTYKWFILEGNWNHYFHRLDLYKDNDFNRFLEFVKFELGKSTPENQDEHIRKQCAYYIPDHIDVIVPMKRLDVFLAHNQLPVLKKQTQSGKYHFSITTEQTEMIRILYNDDYKFIENNKHLLFECF